MVECCKGNEEKSMTIKQARELKVGQKITDKMFGEEYEVVSLEEFRTFRGSTLIYVRCKTENGELMKFSHKEINA